MGLDSVTSNINSAKNFIKNPFDTKIVPSFDPPDFPEGFIIEEILASGSIGDKVVLAGNWMPKIPFTFGGSQRMKKEYYSGYSEPTMQIFGPEETDLTINGLFKDKRFSNLDLKNVSTEIQQMVDGIRIRGNIVKITLGEFVRYGIILTTKFDMEKLAKVGYSITFSIIGFNLPKNARFLQRRKEVPFAINKELIALATEFNLTASNIPDSVPRSLADAINDLVDAVADVINTVTGFVDSVFSAIADIKSAINRVKGLIKHAQQKLKEYKRKVGGVDSFDPTVSVAGRYSSARYSYRGIAAASGLTAMLEMMRARFAAISNDLPLGRHLVRQSETLQKIAIKFYGNSDDWKKIYDYNDLTSTELVVGKLLEIPRL